MHLKFTFRGCLLRSRLNFRLASLCWIVFSEFKFGKAALDVVLKEHG